MHGRIEKAWFAMVGEAWRGTVTHWEEIWERAPKSGRGPFTEKKRFLARCSLYSERKH